VKEERESLGRGFKRDRKKYLDGKKNKTRPLKIGEKSAKKIKPKKMFSPKEFYEYSRDGATTLGITTLSITTLSITTLSMTLQKVALCMKEMTLI